MDNKTETVFITGIGSGLGKALAKYYLEKGSKVIALSRHLPQDLKKFENLYFYRCDLEELEKVYPITEKALKDTKEISIAWLNAGLLTELKDIHDTPIYEMERMMDVNVWANKIILDCFIDLNIKIPSIIAISSGASVNGNRGWHGYSISKASLNMLIKLYSREMDKTKLIALAPGLILTPMLEKFVLSADENKFPSVGRIKKAPKYSPEETVELILSKLDKILSFESGSYIDIRKI
ncbi:MAG: alcohol dehydrogenase [Persephonella sp.]|nr:MAG: alcohol dehydrogenase [Persephonella sp.]RUM61768.1 MAG: alcohol dehydrogenase [Persephonella sp.]